MGAEVGKISIGMVGTYTVWLSALTLPRFRITFRHYSRSVSYIPARRPQHAITQLMLCLCPCCYCSCIPASSKISRPIAPFERSSSFGSALADRYISVSFFYFVSLRLVWSHKNICVSSSFMVLLMNHHGRYNDCRRTASTGQQ